MKKNLILALSAFFFIAVSCNNSNTDKATTSQAQEVAENIGENYNFDNAELKWTAYHKGGLNPRFGVLKTDGVISVENGEITSGSLNSDVNTLVTDPSSVDPSITDGKTSADLDGHLKSQDFFHVEKYPNVKFDITKIEDLAANTESKVEGANKSVSGNLTIKDKTVNVTFPAKVEVSGDKVSLVSKFTINRQDWGLTYGTEGDPKDWMISKDVDLEFNVVATKKS